MKFDRQSNLLFCSIPWTCWIPPYTWSKRPRQHGDDASSKQASSDGLHEYPCKEKIPIDHSRNHSKAYSWIIAINTMYSNTSDDSIFFHTPKVRAQHYASLHSNVHDYLWNHDTWTCKLALLREEYIEESISKHLKDKLPSTNVHV